MKRIVSRSVWASEIAEYLGEKLEREDFIIHKPCSPKYLEDNSVTYNMDDEVNDFTSKDNTVLIISENNPMGLPNVITVENPQLHFYRVVNEFFMDDIITAKPVNAYVSPDAKIGRGVTIGENSYVGSGVTIGANSVLGRNVYIGENTSIGKNCYIKENAVIGSEGYQFIETITGYINKPCLGKIDIKDNVLIGAGSTIETPEFDITEIKNFSKIDDLVNIGSACKIGEKVLIAAGSILCHRVSIGDKTQVGAKSCVREDIVVGSNCVIGIGSVIISNLEDNGVYAGNPAKRIK